MKIIDSHTIGEPTCIIIEGGPDLGDGPLVERAKLFREQHDHIRKALCTEPRGHDAMVGGILVEPHEPDCDAGVIFFNNRSTLDMCIHGTIGLVATLRHMGRFNSSFCRIDTPAGVVTAEVDGDKVSVTNVPCYRTHKNVQVEVPSHGQVTGDIAWGGNWFFLIDGQGPAIDPKNVVKLTAYGEEVRKALLDADIRAEDGHEVDHIELFQKPSDDNSDSRNFVLCPGGAYDRSPCGTGFSAKLACLADDGKLEPGKVWRQASILNECFEGTYQLLEDGKISPRVTGEAWITGETTVHFDPKDPFVHGI